MGLSILEEQTLSILRRLEYQANITRLSDPDVNEVHIGAHDLDLSGLDNVEDLYRIALYLGNEGLDFKVTFDLRNDVPYELHFQGSGEWENIAVIKGKSIKDIEEKIKEIELKLISKKDSKNKVGVKNDQEIVSLELLEDKDEIKAITVFINGDYSNPIFCRRNATWGNMYELARDKQTRFNRSVYDYFNSNKKNPLYKGKEGFKVSKILKKDGSMMVPVVKINLIKQKKISQRLNSA
ncbi:MAG: hypothetical protein KBC11_02665 [Candidatus Pacebacteria bacterium]|nr:hypothetical protein [Candidatus Paceibacterota bacterium]